MPLGDPCINGRPSISCKIRGTDAQFSYAKRMEKITAVLPRTFELLDTDRDAHVRAFVEGCPLTPP